MADTIKLITVFIMISVFLYIGNVTFYDSQNKKVGLFGDDIFTKWLQKDGQGEYTGTYASTVNQTKIYNPSTSTTNTGTSLLNFWDITQIIWDFVILIANIVFAIPSALFFIPSMPYAVKMVLLFPMVIIGISVLVFGIFGRR